MVAGLIILFVLLLISIFFNFLIIKYCQRIIESVGETLTSSAAAMAPLMLDPNFNIYDLADEEIPCLLMITTSYNSPFEGLSFDFSLYEQYNLVGLNCYYTEAEPVDEQGEICDPTVIFVKHAIIYRFGDEYVWDPTALL